MRPAGGLRLGALAWLALTACQSFRPASDAELTQLQLDPGTGVTAESRVGVVTIESSALAGTFDAVLLLERGRHGRARLQLFPELGGKVLDLTAGDEHVAGVIPQAGIEQRADPRAGAMPRHLVVFAAITLLELATPVTRARVLGLRTGAGGRELLLAPRVPGTEVIARLGPDGGVVELRFRYRSVAWRAAAQDEVLVVSAKGFVLRAESREREPEAVPLADELFRLPSR